MTFLMKPHGIHDHLAAIVCGAVLRSTTAPPYSPHACLADLPSTAPARRHSPNCEDPASFAKHCAQTPKRTVTEWGKFGRSGFLASLSAGRSGSLCTGDTHMLSICAGGSLYGTRTVCCKSKAEHSPACSHLLLRVTLASGSAES